jgi:hypothetical protein
VLFGEKRRENKQNRSSPRSAPTSKPYKVKKKTKKKKKKKKCNLMRFNISLTIHQLNFVAPSAVAEKKVKKKIK